MVAPGKGFHELAASRQSIRRFRDDPIPHELIRRLLETAVRAPSAHNRQPWRFVVLEQGDARRQLVRAMSARFRSDLERDGLPESEVDRLVDRGRRRLLDPPVVILLCLTMEDMDPYPDARRQAAERTMATQGVALAGGHLLLAAHAAGLGGCWVCAPLFVPGIVQHELDLPGSWEAQGAIILGWPAERGRGRSRMNLDEVSRWR
jgi:coenzyme F420-0:L-glutamate ligase/coenzyme F420-1:gamma-L-glutamate ligase